MRQSFLCSAPLFAALFSILLPGRLVALDPDLVRVGGYDTSGIAEDVAVSGNYAYVADRDAGLQVIDVSNPASPCPLFPLVCALKGRDGNPGS